jgi:methylated-DNA-[protein]-cysteine S-methyltransferase
LLQHEEIPSPVGPLRLVADGEWVIQIAFRADLCPPPPTSLPAKVPVLGRAAGQLREYFAGTRRTFDLPLDPRGTPFQLQVWELLRSIPYGETTSYGAIAEQLGDPGAARAVGAANHHNPLPIVIPCHRVIGASGRLVGFGGGLAIKAELLALERGERRLF